MSTAGSSAIYLAGRRRDVGELVRARRRVAWYDPGLLGQEQYICKDCQIWQFVKFGNIIEFHRIF